MGPLPTTLLASRGQTDDIYILDLDGERQTIVVSHTPDTSTDITEQLEELLISLEISPIS